jgi:hypothetical protein
MWRGRRGIQTVGLSRGRASSRGSRPPAPDQPQVTLAIGEDAHHVGAALDLLVQALLDLGCLWSGAAGDRRASQAARSRLSGFCRTFRTLPRMLERRAPFMPGEVLWASWRLFSVGSSISVRRFFQQTRSLIGCGDVVAGDMSECQLPYLGRGIRLFRCRAIEFADLTRT